MANWCAGAGEFLNGTACTRPAGESPQVLYATEGVLGLSRVRPSRVVRAESFGSQVNLRHTIREERVTGSASGGTETDSGVPASDKENVRRLRHLVKALRGRRTTKGSSHPRH
jgi:hypothetical protein